MAEESVPLESSAQLDDLKLPIIPVETQKPKTKLKKKNINWLRRIRQSLETNEPLRKKVPHHMKLKDKIKKPKIGKKVMKKKGVPPRSNKIKKIYGTTDSALKK